ncbi:MULTISPECIES: polysaccharide deacetylase family protein [Paenibacillus]|uniref:polysaccharide deacetylase family protein n=1 Tax=Paenibacillus TaxID=44249 RepID=UPI0022B873EB|nr:polysaccharide deacetylase family protein [Paenibacillus caseinilyticus]MCZ8520570.1 polysaccharide deacetylase family protein [Paenibacillus caseinilyticus]
MYLPLDLRLLAALGAALLLGSCNSAAPAAPPSQAAAPASSPPAPAAGEPAQEPVPAAAGDSAARPSPSEQHPEPEKKRYRLNTKTYDIKPADGSEAPAKVVLLTFDDGPKELALNESLLGTLDKHKAKAIFFVNGYRVRQNPDILKLIHSRGHTIGNHSWDHIDLKKESAESVERQIGDVQQEVRTLTGEAPRFFRPPFGSGSETVREAARAHNLLYMTWSNGSKDWEMTTKKNDPQKVVTNVLEQLRPGSNILMHELPWTAQALDQLLSSLEEKGYGFADPASLLSE